MALDWINRLFPSSAQTRGLSGASTSQSVALDATNPYYNFRLRRHRAVGDLVEDPKLIWLASADANHPAGLSTHFADEQVDGVVNFTDVLVVMSRQDYVRAFESTDGQWAHEAVRILTERCEEHSHRERLTRLFPDRPIGFRVVCDGADEIGGKILALEGGEFVTGLMPNFYTGPTEGSWPVIAVHVNLPGVWEGYQEIGRLYNDQVLFTLGSHWLDNFAHPALRESALYRLQQYPDGSFYHIINPDLQDRYQVTSTDQDGAAVLTIATRDGEALAYVVLHVLDKPSASAAGQSGEDSSDVSAESGPPATPVMLGAADIGNRTIIPEAPTERIFTLQERGALLQRVHFSAFMAGYDVYVGVRGELGTVVDEIAAAFQVRKRKVSLQTHVPNVIVDGKPVASGATVALNKDHEIEVAGQRYEYKNLRSVAVDGWPYVGEIRRPASSAYMMWGRAYSVGRSPNCRVVLPDEPSNTNIHWKGKVAKGAMIRAKSGDIPKSRFYTDSIMVSSEHLMLELKGEECKAVCKARRCYVFVRRDRETGPSEVFSLYPTESGTLPTEMALEPGDEILVGNCLFHVGFSPLAAAEVPAPAPTVSLTGESLAGHVAVLSASADAPATTDDSVEPALPIDIPPASGFGELGAAPLPVALEHSGPDSVVVFDDSEVSDGDAESGGADADAQLSPESGEPASSDAAEQAPPAVDVPKASLPSSPDEAEVPPPPPAPESPPAPEPDPPADDVASPPPPPELSETDSEPPPAPDVPEEEEVEPPSAPVLAADEGPLSEMPSEEASPAMEEDAPSADGPEAPDADGEFDESGWGEVVFVDDQDAQFELGRPAQVVQVGWIVDSALVCGNHTNADLILPENRVAADQELLPCDYFMVKARGKRGWLEVLGPDEVLIDGDLAADTRYEDPMALAIEVIRRDDMGEEDFAVNMRLEQDKTLPNPRSSLLTLDSDEPLVGALVTRGLPTRTSIQLTLGAIKMTCMWNGESLEVSDYITDYSAGSDGYRPFFIQQGGGRFRTVAEDGSPFQLSPGDRMIVESSVFEFRLSK